MRFIAICAVILGLLEAALVPCALAVDARQIDAAIANGKKYLYTQFQEGNWERETSKYEDITTGQTALAVRALLEAGESYQEPRIAEAIAYIRKTPTTGVFSLGMRCQLWAMLPRTPENRQALAKDGSQLVNNVQRQGKHRGFYNYLISDKEKSNVRSSYYAAIGLWSADQAGYEVNNSYWQLVEKAWMDAQDPGGGWGFYGKASGNSAPTPGTTANGIATLFITHDFLHADEAITLRGNIKHPQIDRGINWLASNFGLIAKDTKFKFDFPYSTLYAIEQVGSASGLKYFKDIDWYDVGADRLLRNQHRDGWWAGDYKDAKVTGTAFALLFLTSGRAPVVMNKLQYDSAPNTEANWNQRPRDVANITRWVGKQTERTLNWQIVNLKAPLEDLHEAPILYLSGNQELKFDAAQTEKLRDYVEGGGMILGNADANSGTFSNSYKALGKSLFPDYEFRQIPPQHPIFTNQQYPAERWKKKPTVLSLSNGAREMMLLLPDTDVARAWQLRETSSKEELFQFAADLFQYSIDKREAHNKGERFGVAIDTRIKPSQTMTVARLKYPGIWNPEPGGWRRMATILNNRDRIGVKLATVDLSAEAIAAGTKLAHLTGIGKFKLSDDARGRLKKFVEGGGLLFVDAAGGNGEFAQAAEAELAAIFGADAVAKLKDPLPPTHAIYNVGGRKMEDVGYRTFARQIQPGELKGPRLRGIEFKGRLGVLFSAEDLSVGMVGHPVDGINGYDPKSATTIVRNLLLGVADGSLLKAAASSTSRPTTNTSTSR